MILKNILKISFYLIFLMTAHLANAESQLEWALEPWPQWMTTLKQEAINQGISSNTFNTALNNMQGPDAKILTLLKTQPEQRLTYNQYLNTRASADRIAFGQKEYQQYQTVLQAIQQDYGVDPCIIVALWGMETSYGHFMGNFSTPQALATLAYASDRPAFFRNELLQALHMINDHQVTLKTFKGEWAGASGQCQFLPSSWYQYAVDYDNDGQKNIWSSVPDVLASVANYMKQNGWESGHPLLITVQLPDSFDPIYVQTREIKTLQEWANLGVLKANGQPLPNNNTPAFLVHPDGGPIWLALNNFQTVLNYNNSIYYVGAINYMADQICHR